MGRAIAAFSGSAVAFPVARLSAYLHRLMRTMFSPYRPELHYMRGPGPAWRAKHGSPLPRGRT